MSASLQGRVGPKAAVGGGRGACASQHPLVTDAMVDVMGAGGNASDAAIAGCLLAATVQQEMTNHAGSVSCLYWDAGARELHELSALGAIAPDRPPCEPVSGDRGVFTRPTPFAVVPGFMPGLKALHERFATRPWAELCAPAIRCAREGHVVGSFEHRVVAGDADFWLASPSGREHWTPDGHLPQVGERWPKPALAATLERLASEGPDEFVTGAWARAFVARANALGWEIELRDMGATPPRWGGGMRWQHRGHEIVQLAPPERVAVFSATVLGVLDALDARALGHYASSPETLYYFAHAMRVAELEGGFLNDPTVFGDPSAALMSPEHHRLLATVLRESRPRRDMTRHVELAHGRARLAAAGLAPPPSGSCELSVVDPDGNWAQVMTTLQSGGIPGEVVGGVPMVGSHGHPGLRSPIAGWFTGGARLRCVLGCTFVLRDGAPWLALGTPGAPHWTVPQVLSSLLDHEMDPRTAIDQPRFLPLSDAYELRAESGLPGEVVAGLARLGVLVDPLPRYHYPLGSFQMCWRAEDGAVHAISDPRRAGKAAAVR